MAHKVKNLDKGKIQAKFHLNPFCLFVCFCLREGESVPASQGNQGAGQKERKGQKSQQTPTEQGTAMEIDPKTLSS